jgi:hypothetical protein
MSYTKVAVGTVPTQINYVYSSPEQVVARSSWDDTKNKTSITVYSSYPVEVGDEKCLERAKKWAEYLNLHSWDTKAVKHIVQIDTLNNDPLEKLKLISLESRGEGGRAYKVLVNDKYYVDLREDVLMDVMIQVGVEPGGILGGYFIWAKLANQMRLVRVGSELHKMLVDSHNKKDMPKISKSNLEVGGVYKTRQGSCGIFISYVNTVRYEPKDTFDSFSFQEIPDRKQMLFFSCRQDNVEASLAAASNRDFNVSFHLYKTHNFIEKVGQVSITKNYVELIKKYAQDKIKDDVLVYTGHKVPANKSIINKHMLAGNICYFSNKLNLSVYGEPAPELFNVKKYLLFS